MMLEAKRPEDIPDGWIGLARIRGLFRPTSLRALEKRGEFVHVEDSACAVHPDVIEACFDFPVVEALTAQPPRAIPALATGQHWRNAKGDSLTIGPTTRGKELGSSFACFLLLKRGDFTSSCHERDALMELVFDEGFVLVAGPGSEQR